MNQLSKYQLRTPIRDEKKVVFDNRWSVAYYEEFGIEYVDVLVHSFLSYLNRYNPVTALDVEAWWNDMSEMYSTLGQTNALNIKMEVFLREPRPPYRKTHVFTVSHYSRVFLMIYEPSSWNIY